MPAAPIRSPARSLAAGLLVLGPLSLCAPQAHAVPVTFDLRYPEAGPNAQCFGSAPYDENPFVTTDPATGLSLTVRSLVRGLPHPFCRDTMGAGPDAIVERNTGLVVAAIYKGSNGYFNNLGLSFDQDVKLLSIDWLGRSSVANILTFTDSLGNIIDNVIGPTNPYTAPFAFTIDYSGRDINYVSSNFSFQSSTAESGFSLVRITVDDFSVAAVPEPATIALMGLGLVGATVGRQRRRTPRAPSAM